MCCYYYTIAITCLKDLESFGLNYLELIDIKNMKKEHFKKLVNEKCKESALKYLLEGNEEKSKLE